MSLRPLSLTCALALATAAFTSTTVSAQSSKNDWQKSYNVGSGAALSLEATDAGIQVRACGSCSSISIHAHSDDLTRFNLEEHQDGAHVFFSLKEKLHVGFHMNWHNNTQVTVEVPSHLDLDVNTSDGSVAIAGLYGNAHLHSSDGSISVDGYNGALRLSTSDGSIHVHNAAGTIDAGTSDGSAKVDGKFSSVQLKSSDGSLDLTLQPGSNLTAPSNIHTSDGHVTVHVPHDLAASLEVSASDGRIESHLPLTVDGFDSRKSPHSHLSGRMNSGTVALTIRTSDGNITLTEL
ncbi:MAG: DUF4097 family beta strand repeat-containing protein [Acidobacteriota bacterium]